MLSPILTNRRRTRRGREGLSIWLRLLLSVLAVALAATVALASIAAGALVVTYNHFARGLPTAEEFEQLAEASFETTKIYDRTGQHLLWEAIDPEAGDRTKVPFHEIPEHMRNATVALEDKTFYTNPAGINIEGLLRAAWNNLRGLPVQGGSSITAQLVRNVVMDPEERFAISYERKIKEAILSYELTRRFPGPEGRDRILEWYLNTVSYGGIANGVEAAAKVYFGKHARDLTLAESAMLAAIPQYPAMNPIDNPEQAKRRQGYALDAMVAQEYITPAEAEAARHARLGTPSPPAEVKIEAPHFVMYLLQLLEQRYGKRGVYGGGLRVISSLDLELQKECEEILREQIESWPASHRARNGAAVVIRPDTGELLAMVGSVDYFSRTIDGEVNMAVEPRQPGSSFKPFTYAAAFEQGYSPASVLYDVRTSFPVEGAAPYVPENFDRQFHGPMSLRRALACSYNIPAVDLLDRIGIDSALEMAHRLGITGLRNRKLYGLALTLGGGEISLIDHTYAFSVLANDGVMAGAPVPPERQDPGYRQLDPVTILKVTDGQGRVVDEFRGPTVREVLSPQVAYMVTNILSDNAARTPAFGANSALVLDRPAAAKTGTTDNYCDAWTVGYTPQVAVGVWVGNADRTPMEGMWGARGAAPIWRDIMLSAHRDQPVVAFVEPPGMKWLTVDADSGLLPGPHTRATVKELFIAGLEPRAVDNVHQQVAICRASGRLATSHCPPEETEQQVFVVYPYHAGDWVRETEQPAPPPGYCDLHGPTNLRAADASITYPGIYQSVGGLVQITGNARIPGQREYQLEYGPGLQPTEWFPIGGPHHDGVENQLLAEWDASQLAGLYTLRLTVRGDGDRQVTVPVTVDNTPPAVALIHPQAGDLYVKETDGFVNLQALARDNMAMDRVEFLVDGEVVGEKRIVPYSLRWDIVMTDTSQAIVPPVPDIPGGELHLEEDGQPVTWRRVTQGETTTITKEVGADEELRRTTIIRDAAGLTVILPSGWGARWTEDGYQEVHTLQAVAYDAAGNKTESEPVLIYVEHRKLAPFRDDETPTG